MKTLVALFLFFGFLISSAFGQSSQEVYPKQVHIEHNDAVKSFSKDYVSLFRTSDLGLFADHENGSIGNISVTGSENVSFLLQQGYGIKGFIDVVGDHNLTSLQQQGGDLMSTLDIQGNQNQMDMTQQGFGLSNSIQLFGSGSNIDAMHTSQGLFLQQSGPGVIPLTIEQKGRPSPLIIRNY